MPSPFAEAFAKFINTLLRAVGLGRKTEEESLRAQIQEWNRQKRSLNDEVESMKAEIRDVEGQIAGKKRELDNTKGESRDIVIREIKSLFFELDAKKGKHDIIFSDLGAVSTMVGKADEMLQRSNITPDVIREFQILGALRNSERREKERELERLRGAQSQAAVPEVMNFEARLAALTGGTPAPTTTTNATTTTAAAETTQPTRTESAAVEQRPAAQTLSDADLKRLDGITASPSNDN
jgi:prophage DNA circulation protein